jgi:hypothetical protein
MLQHISGLAVVYDENDDIGTHPASTQCGVVETRFNKTHSVPPYLFLSLVNHASSLRYGGSVLSTLCPRPVSAFR